MTPPSIESTLCPTSAASCIPSQVPSYGPVSGSVTAYAIVNQVLSNITYSEFKKNEAAIDAAIIQTVKLSSQDSSIIVQILNITSTSRRRLSSLASLLIQYKITFPSNDVSGGSLSQKYDLVVSALTASVSNGNFTKNLHHVASASGIVVLTHTDASVAPSVSALVVTAQASVSPSSSTPRPSTGPVSGSFISPTPSQSLTVTSEPSVEISSHAPITSSSNTATNNGLSTANIVAIAILSISALSIFFFFMCFRAYQNISKGNKLRSIGDVEVGSIKLRSASDRLDEPLYKRHFPKTLATRDDSFFDSIYAENPRIAQQNLKATLNPLRQGSSSKPAIATAKRSVKAARLKRLNDKINEVLENFDKTLSRRDFNEYVSELGSVIQRKSKQTDQRLRPSRVPLHTTSVLESKVGNEDNGNSKSDDDEDNDDDENNELQTEVEIRRAAANQKLMDMVKIAHNEYLRCVEEEAAAALQLQEANRLVREAELRRDRESEKLVTIDQRLSILQSTIRDSNPRESMYLEQMKKESETRLSMIQSDIHELKLSTELRFNLQEAENKRVSAETRAEVLLKELGLLRNDMATAQSTSRHSVQVSAPVMRETTVSTTNTDSTQVHSDAGATTTNTDTSTTTTATATQVSEDIKKDLDRLAALEAKILLLETRVTAQQKEARVVELEMQIANESTITTLLKSDIASSSVANATVNSAYDAMTAEERELEIEAMIRMDMYESEATQYDYESSLAIAHYDQTFKSLEDEISQDMFLHEDEEEAMIQEAYNRILMEEEEEQNHLREVELEIEFERQQEDDYQNYLAQQEQATWLIQERERKEKAFQDFLRTKKESILSVELSRNQELEKQRAFEEYRLQRMGKKSSKK